MEWHEQEELLQCAFDLLLEGQYGDARSLFQQMKRFDTWHPDGVCYIVEETGEELTGPRDAIDCLQGGKRVIVRRRTMRPLPLLVN